MEQARKKSKEKLAASDIYIYSMSLNTSTYPYDRKPYTDAEHCLNPERASCLFLEKSLSSQ